MRHSPLAKAGAKGPNSRGIKVHADRIVFLARMCVQGAARIWGIGLFQVYLVPASSVRLCSPNLGSTIKESAEVCCCCCFFLTSLVLIEVLFTPLFIIWLVSLTYLQVCSIMLNKAGI